MQRFSRGLLAQCKLNNKLSAFTLNNVKLQQTRNFSSLKQNLDKISASAVSFKDKFVEKRYKLDRAILASLFPVASCATETPVDPAVVSDATAAGNAVAEALAYTPPSTWSKAGFILDKPIWIIEYLHHSLDLPLWASIIGLGLLIRTATAPVAMKQQFASIRMALIQPEIQRLTEAMKRAPPGSLAVKEIQQKVFDVYNKHDVNPVKTIGYAFISFPFMVACFMGVRNMALDPDYHTRFLSGGFEPFLDLTVDAGWLIACVASLSNLAIFQINNIGQKASDFAPQQRLIMNIVKGVVVLSTPVLAQMPLAVMVYLLTNNVYTIFLNLLLRTDAMRRAFNMPTTEEVLSLKLKTQAIKAERASPVGLPADAPKTAYVLPTKQQTAAANATVTPPVNPGPRKKRFTNTKA